MFLFDWIRAFYEVLSGEARLRREAEEARRRQIAEAERDLRAELEERDRRRRDGR
jgi:hypothetical protein